MTSNMQTNPNGFGPGTRRNRLGRAAGVAPCKGVGAATRSARNPGVCQ
jgi:hypothetical protein